LHSVNQPIKPNYQKMNTLRLISVVLLASTLTTSLIAQDDKDKKPALITFTAGWSNADLTQDDSSTDTRNGFFAGVRKDIKIIPMLHLNTGLLYVQKGASIDFGGSGKEDFKLDYLDIPVGLKLKVGPVFATGGVSANFRLSSQFAGEKVDDINGFELASSLGVGVKLLIFSLDLRWNNSFGDIVKDNEGSDIRNSYFLIGLGVSIHRK